MRDAAKTAIIPFALGLISLVAAKGAGIQTLIETGDSGPSNGDTFLRFGLPTLNDPGQVAYSATLNGVSPTDYGIYYSLVTATGATQVVRALDAAPGGGVFDSGFSSPPAITASGEVAFFDYLRNTTQTDGIFGMSSTGVGTRFAGPGNTAPNGDGTLNAIANANYVNFNNNRQAAFYDTLSGTSKGTANDEAIFRAGTSPGSLVEIVRAGSSVPDGNGTFGKSLNTSFISTAFSTNPSMNDAGTVAFGAGIKGSNTQIPGYNSSFDSGLFIGNGSSVVQIARAGETGIPGGGAFTNFLSSPAINNKNQVAFVAEYNRNLTTTGAIYRNDSGTLVEIAHAGEALPGGGSIYNVSNSVVINDVGQVASIYYTGPNNGTGGIIRGSGGPLTIIAQNGESTPRGGATIMTNFIGGSSIAMNVLGDIAFTAGLDTNPTLGVTDSKGLFLYSDRFGLSEIAQYGDALNGSTITGLDLAGATAFANNSPLQMGLNNNDQVVFRFDLANGKEGISVWSIPEPNSVSLFALSAGCIVVLSLIRRSTVWCRPS